MANNVEQESPGSFTGGDKSLPTQRVFTENLSTIKRNYTLQYNKNAMAVGPLYISDGATITVSQGSTLVII